jgi:soluble lytic murein transglycosylase-like protein
LINQESNGRVGAIGPQTPYGQAQGLGQQLPSTAQGIAKKLGVPWRPDLMTGTSDAAKQYQSAMTQSYLEEALDKTGNVADALKYYHGGPNRKLWGPKTEAYSASILRRLGA